jgi:hypothetical protein
MQGLEHTDFSVEASEDVLAVHFGAWCFEIAENGNRLKDYSNDLSCRPQGMPVEEVVANISTEQAELSKKWAEKRFDVLTCIPVHFPVQSHNNQIQPTADALAD